MPAPDRKGKNKRTLETLHHFSCGKCGKWWTIGDAPKTKRAWYCPWCGSLNKYRKTG